MPLGVSLRLEGLLREHGGHLYLRMDDGGGWRVEAGWRARKLVGRRVRIEGTRDGFDLVVAKRVVLCLDRSKLGPLWSNFRAWP